MTDLESTAAAAQASVQEFDDHLQQAHAALGSLQSDVTRLSDQMESDWTALAEAARSLLGTAQSQRTSVDEHGQQASQALARLMATIGTTTSEALGELGGARDELAGLSKQAEADQQPVHAMADDLRAVAHRLAEHGRELESQLDQALQEARDFLGVEMVADLRTLHQAIEQRATNLQAMVTEQCQGALEEAYQDFETKMDELDDLVREKAFVEPQQHLEEVVRYSLQEEYKPAQTHALDDLAAQVDTLERDIQGFRTAVEQRAEEARHDKDSLEQEVGSFETLLAGMLTALTSIKELMARYSFVQL